MGCCGQNRERQKLALVFPIPQPSPANSLTPASNASIPSKPAATSGSDTKLRYTGVAEITVRGPRSNRTYSFSGRNPERLVDRADVGPLMRTGLFRQKA